MTLRDLLKKKFWSATDLARATGLKERTAQRRLTEIRAELKKEGYINMHHSLAPTSVIVDKLKLDIPWFEEHGMMDEELLPPPESKHRIQARA